MEDDFINIEGFYVCQHFIDRWQQRSGKNILDMVFALRNAKKLSKNKCQKFSGILHIKHNKDGVKTNYFWFDKFIFIKRKEGYITCISKFYNRQSKCNSISQHYSK